MKDIARDCAMNFIPFQAIRHKKDLKCLSSQNLQISFKYFFYEHFLLKYFHHKLYLNNFHHK